MATDRIFELPLGLTSEDVCAFGNSGAVARLNAVVKCALPLPYSQEDIRREQRVYTILAPYRHPGLLRYFGPLPGSDALILEYAPHGCLRQHLKTPGLHIITAALRSRWIVQIIETIAFIHTKGILHTDISANNIFLDEDWNVRVGDFAGASIDGEESTGYYEDGYYHPRDRYVVCAASEIFALGSLFYEILTGGNPYLGLEDGEVEDAFRGERYPDLEGVDDEALRGVIRRCWKEGGYRSVEEVLVDVKGESPAGIAY